MSRLFESIPTSCIPLALALGYVVAAFLVDTVNEAEPHVHPNTPPASENSIDRERFEWMRTRSIVTGEVPNDMREQELRFVGRRFAEKVTKTGTDFQWRARGPFNVGGRTRALALDATDENVILAGAVSGGLWRSEDAGESWIKVTSPELPHNVTAIVQDVQPGRTDIWYMGTGESRGSAQDISGAGVYRSDDGGTSWTRLPSSPRGLEPGAGYSPVRRLLIDRNAPGRDLYAATQHGIYRTRDGGETWTLIIASKPRYMEVDIVQAASSGVFYAASPTVGASSRFLRSEDGDHWVDITPDRLSGFFIYHMTMAISPADERIVYFLTSQGKLWRYEYQSGDGSGAGGIWEERTSGLTPTTFNSQGGYCMVIAVHPVDPDVVFVGGVELVRSTNGFSTKDNAVIIGWHLNHHPDQHAILFSPSDPNVMYSAHDGGVSRTDNALAEDVEWETLENGYITSQFYTVAIDQSAPGDSTIVGGMQDNGTDFVNSNTENARWTHIQGGDGGYAAIARNKEYYYVSYQNGQVLREEIDPDGNRLDERGRETHVDPKDSGNRLFVHPWVLNPVNTKMMFYSGETHIWRNHDVTQIPKFARDSNLNWVKLSATEGERWATALEMSTNPPNRLYYAREEGQMFRLDKANEANPVPVDISSNRFPTGFQVWINSIAVDRQDGDHALIAISNYESPSIFFTTNGGGHWSPAGGNLEEFPDGSGSGPSVRWVEILNHQGTRYYFAGTSVGLFYTTELRPVITEWYRTGTETIGNVRVDMIDSRDEDALVVVATHGNGIYSTNVGSTAPVAAEESPQIPAGPSLSSNYPNPFSGSTTIAFTLDGASEVTLEVFDALGRRVTRLIDAQRLGPGRHTQVWDAGDLPSGRYVYRIEAGKMVEVEVATLVRDW
ncbi:MAG TPA: T9SS type A sorting domain-containing protein [Rhodothermales bacterium]|nr:T9SS type A sorting domain-containing protein [Rhodothermales bacterium]